MTKHCNIVYDLLPLYVDNACSEESKNMVEQHLKACPECKKKHEAMTTTILDVSMLPSTDAQSILLNRGNAAIKVIKRIKRRWMLSTLAILLLVPFIWLGVNQYRGEGLTYTNLYDQYSAVQFLHALEEKKYDKAYSYMNVKYYYEHELPKKLNDEENKLKLEDYLLIEHEGNQYYLNDTMLVSADNIDEYLLLKNEWYNMYKDMTYEQFYEASKINFVENMKEWEQLGYEITGFSLEHIEFINRSGHEVNALSFNIEIWNGVTTFKSNKLVLTGNNEGLFNLSGTYFSYDDLKMQTLIDGLSVW